MYLVDCPKADDNLKLPRSPVPEPEVTSQRGELGELTLSAIQYQGHHLIPRFPEPSDSTFMPKESESLGLSLPKIRSLLRRPTRILESPATEPVMGKSTPPTSSGSVLPSSVACLFVDRWINLGSSNATFSDDTT